MTDPSFSDAQIVRCVIRVAGALPEGALAVQLRDKRRPLTSLRMLALELRRITTAYGALLIVNAHLDVARDVGADGVHLGSGAATVSEARSMLSHSPWISVAAHGPDDVRRARSDRVDGILASPIFPTQSRTAEGHAKHARGLTWLRAAKKEAGQVLVYALGGIAAASAPACFEAGADGVALMRGLLSVEDPARVARAIHDVWAHR